MRAPGGAVTLILIGMVDLIVIALGMGAVMFLGLSHGFYAYAMIACALITFFGFLWLGFDTSGQSEISAAAMRNAITASVMALYLSLVGFQAFYSRESTPNPMAQTLVSNFTTLVGAITAFYFTSTAYVEVRSRRAIDTRPSDGGTS